MDMDWVTAIPAIMAGCFCACGICGGLLIYMKWMATKEKPRQ